MLGQTGNVMVESADGAVTLDPPCHTIEAVNGVTLVISALTDAASVNGDGTTTNRVTSILPGCKVFGVFTLITVTSGTARCYKI